MEQRLTIVTLGVTDMAAALEFYENKFGWTRVPAEGEKIVFFQLNGIQMALYPLDKFAEDTTVAPGNPEFHPVTFAYNTRSESEVDQLIDELENKGVTIIKRPQKVFWGGYSSYISDPDGNLWEIAYNPFLPLDEMGNTGG